LLESNVLLELFGLLGVLEVLELLDLSLAKGREGSKQREGREQGK
jgi:hypothetical protein